MTTSPTMQAAVLESHGAPFRLASIARPVPQAGQVLVRIMASGINPLDAVKKLSGHIIAIHLKDIAAYNDPKLVDVPVGTGIVDFPAIFKELKRQGFAGPIYIERDAVDQPNNLKSVKQEVQYYNQQIQKLQ